MWLRWRCFSAEQVSSIELLFKRYNWQRLANKQWIWQSWVITQRVALWDSVITQKLKLARLDYYLVCYIEKTKLLLSKSLIKLPDKYWRVEWSESKWIIVWIIIWLFATVYAVEKCKRRQLRDLWNTKVRTDVCIKYRCWTIYVGQLGL